MGQRLRADAQVQHTAGRLSLPGPRAAPEEAARYRAKLEAAEAAAGGSLPGAYRHKPHLVYTWAQELIRHPKILDAVEALIGPDILAWESVFFIKEPQTTDYISWHQDITYWGLDQEGDVVTAWLALSPSTPESGCMRVVPGTHQREVVAHKDTFGEQQHALARPGDRGRGRRGPRGRPGPAAGPDVAAPRQDVPRLAPQPRRRPADRLRDPLPAAARSTSRSAPTARRWCAAWTATATSSTSRRRRATSTRRRWPCTRRCASGARRS